MSKPKRLRLGQRAPSAKPSALHTHYRHGTDDRRLPADYPTLLPVALEAAVPLEIARLQQQGGPRDRDWRRVREFGERLAAHGDALLFAVSEADAGATTRKLERMAAEEEGLAAAAACRKDEAALRSHAQQADALRADARRHEGADTANMFAGLARALAVLAFVEGGVEFAGRRWRVEHVYLPGDVPPATRLGQDAACLVDELVPCQDCGARLPSARQVCCGEWVV